MKCGKIVIGLAVLGVVLWLGTQSRRQNDPGDAERVLRLNSGGVIKTLDPAQAGDLSSRNMVNAFYDTLLEYDYVERPYALRPSMLTKMPEISADQKVYTFELRDDLYFAADPVFGAERNRRKVSSDDVLYSFKRIADGRAHSPVYWLWRGKIAGVEDFHQKTSQLPADATFAQVPCAGFKRLDERRFQLILQAPDPRFLYNLAIPYTAIVSQKAAEFYGVQLAAHPVGSGPFTLGEWVRDYKMVLLRNPDYREQYFAPAQGEVDRDRKLPLLDRIECLIVKQPFAAWLLFLQGNLDLTVPDKDNLDVISGTGNQVAQVLAERGIKLVQSPLFEVRYIGFNFLDPVLGKNENLRKAISLAYNIDRRVEHANCQLLKAQGVIPPRVAGHEETLVNPYNQYNPELARQYLAKAGYANGIDPETGEALTLTFDQNGSSSYQRQLGEMMVSDLAKIGIRVLPQLNNGPRFFAKLNQGSMQLFRLSWIGDYPDAENFLQLFYSKYIGGCNRVGYVDLEYDRRFELIQGMPESPERTELYRQMNRYLIEKAPWIFESYPIGFILHHQWVQNYRTHDFGFGNWKYLAVNPELRVKRKKSFRALDFAELRN